MYLSHFGLSEPPFTLTPDTSFYFACSAYQEAMNTLMVAAMQGEGFIKITGEVGNGKTMLCRKFLANLADANQKQDNQHGFVTAFLPNPYLEPRSLLLALAEEFHASVDAQQEQHEILKQLTRVLLEFAREGKRVIVCLDEAQAMPLESLEVLRLLTNLETEKRKLMQVVLFGQPELDERLKQNSVRQLRQRISFQYHLKGLHRDELDRYLRYRLGVSGYTGETLFSTGAVARLHRVTGGTPRLVNIIASKAMMLAYGEGRKQVTSRHIGKAAADTPESRTDWHKWLWSAFALLLGAELVISWMVMK